MTIIQALENTTIRLEQYDAQMKSGISHERAEVILAESEKMDTVFREAEFYIKRPDLFGNQAHLKKPLNKALSVYVRVVQGCIDHGFQACDEKTDKISRHLIQRLAELEKEIEDVQQPIAASPMEAHEGNLSLVTLPNDILKEIFGFLGDEFLFVLKFTCKKFNDAIHLKRQTDPFRITVQGPTLVSIINSNFCARVARHGHTNLLQWARTNGCPWNKKTCSAAARNGHLGTLMWARANGCPWDAATCARAALNGHLEVLQWARANRCPWDEWTCAKAAANGHLETLKWLRANGCPWDASTCARAAENGHLETLKWLITNGCSSDKWTCAMAALNGHLETLIWARANGCPWNEETCSFAAEKGHLEILQWARANGAPWNEDIIRRNAIRHPEVLKWLDSLEGTA